MLNKTIKKTKDIYNFFDTDFWFGKEENKSDKKILYIKSENETLKNVLTKNENILESGINNFSGISFQDLKKDRVYENQKEICPNGYIKLNLENIDTNELFIKHNITLKYIQVENNMYIKSILLVNDDKELDCFSVGENHSLKIKKENNSILKLFIQEINGNVDEIMIVNGRVVA
jgi:hypothetical protein